LTQNGSAGEGVHMHPPPKAIRHRLPDVRKGLNHKFSIYGQGSDGEPGKFNYYVTVGCYEDGSVGEIFVRGAKEGSSLASVLDAWCTAVSMALQSGVQLETITSKFKFWSFEPAGQTESQHIRFCKSPIDYLCRWLELRFVGEETESDVALTASLPPVEEDSVSLTG